MFHLQLLLLLNLYLPHHRLSLELSRNEIFLTRNEPILSQAMHLLAKIVSEIEMVGGIVLVVTVVEVQEVLQDKIVAGTMSVARETTGIVERAEEMILSRERGMELESLAET
jgi:hypothetical protein